MGKKATAGAGAEPVAKVQTGLVFELETLAVAKGRKVLWDVWDRLLAERDAKLSPGLFSRFCLDASPKEFLPHLLEALGKGRFSPDKLLEEYKLALCAAFGGKKLTLDPAVGSVLKAAAADGMLLGALSGLEVPTAEHVMEELGLDTMGVKLFCAPSLDHRFPTADSWVRLAKELSVRPFRCVALTSSGISCRSAVAVDMWCLAIPDEFTAFQDFGGAEAVVSKLDEKALRDVTATMGLQGS